MVVGSIFLCVMMVVVMGVLGSGKSIFGVVLVGVFGVCFFDVDDLYLFVNC